MKPSRYVYYAMSVGIGPDRRSIVVISRCCWNENSPVGLAKFQQYLRTYQIDDRISWISEFPSYHLAKHGAACVSHHPVIVIRDVMASEGEVFAEEEGVALSAPKPLKKVPTVWRSRAANDG